MHLRCQRHQRITIDGEQLELTAGTTIPTENSYKFTRDELQALLDETGFALRHWWEASDPSIGLCLADAVWSELPERPRVRQSGHLAETLVTRLLGRHRARAHDPLTPQSGSDDCAGTYRYSVPVSATITSY
jgi:hypothetical protein